MPEDGTLRPFQEPGVGAVGAAGGSCGDGSVWVILTQPAREERARVCSNHPPRLGVRAEFPPLKKHRPTLLF